MPEIDPDLLNQLYRLEDGSPETLEEYYAQLELSSPEKLCMQLTELFYLFPYLTYKTVGQDFMHANLEHMYAIDPEKFYQAALMMAEDDSLVAFGLLVHPNMCHLSWGEADEVIQAYLDQNRPSDQL